MGYAPPVLEYLRVIDLADHRGIFCAKALGDLGADVVKVEPPDGDPARSVGPFAGGEPGPERSLFWQGFATGRRSLTLDVTRSEGQALLRRLAAADFLVESFAPGFMDSIGLGYEALKALNPRLIMVSITPFGSSGPKSAYAATDLTGAALGGSMAMTGEPDRPPVRVSHSPQFWLVGGAAGAAGAMIAHHHRLLTGEGQHVDVSCQQAMARTLSHAPQVWDLTGVNLGRSGAYRMIGDVTMRITYPCADGYLAFFFPAGAVGARSMRGLAAWMREEGEPDSFIESADWEAFEFGTTPQAVLDRLDASLSRFFTGRSKRALADGAAAHRVILFPATDADELLEHPQLAARSFWQKVDLGEIGAARLPGGLVRVSGERVGVRRRAPRVGEHTRELLAEAGLTDTEVADLAGRGIV